MAVIGKLSTLVDARTAPFEKGMKRSRASLNKFGDSVDRRRGTIGKLDAALTASASRFLAWGAAIAAGGRALRSVLGEFDAIDKIAKQADRIGETTENLVGLQHAAELTGAGSDKLSAGLTTMSKRLGEAADGTGSARKQLDKLGLSARQLIEMRPAEAFKTIADRVSQLDTQSEKAAATAAIFSRGNLELVNTLEEGRAGLEAMADEAERLGKTFSRIDAAEIEAANDAMTRMRASTEGMKRTAAIELAPSVDGIASGFESWAAKIKPAVQAIGFLGEGLGAAMALSRDLESQIAATPLMFTEGLGLTEGPDHIPFENFMASVDRFEASMRRRQSQRFEASPGMQKLIDQSRERQKKETVEREKNTEAAEKQRQKFEQVADALRKENAVLEHGEQKLQIRRELDVAVGKEQERAIRQLQARREQLEKLNKAEEESERQERRAQELDRVRLGNINDILQRMRQRVQVLRAGSDGFDRMRLKALQAGDAQLAMFDAMSKTVDRMERFNDLQQRGAQLMERFKSPLEKFREELEELNKLRRIGAIDARTFGLARAEAFERAGGIGDQADRGPPRLAGAIEQGSSRAQEIVAAARGIMTGPRKVEQQQLTTLQNIERALTRRRGIGGLDLVNSIMPGREQS